MSFARYLKYKDSGVEWLGEVPAHWEIKRIKHLVVTLEQGWSPQCEGFPVQSEEGWGVLKVGCVNGGIFRPQENKALPAELEPIAELGLAAGDLLISRANTRELVGGAAVALQDYPRLMLCDKLYRIRLHCDFCEPVFLALYLGSDRVRGQIELAATGASSSMLNIGQSTILELQFAVPPLNEQQEILKTVARQMETIDALVAEQEKLIALLKEKRQAVISHAVTKGLDPSVPMKDSGVEWLGEVPGHWEIKRIKHLVLTLEQGWSPQCEGFPVQSDEEWGVLKVGCVNGGVFRPEENKALPPELEPVPELGLVAGDLLISRANTRELVGGAAVILQDYPRLMLCDKLYRIRFHPGFYEPEFLALYLGSDRVRGQIELAATGASSSMLNIGQSTILELNFAVPLLDEQQQILMAVAHQIEKTDALVEKSQSAITLLQERRTALISAAVTGQIDVRGFAPEKAA